MQVPSIGNPVVPLLSVRLLILMVKLLAMLVLQLMLMAAKAWRKLRLTVPSVFLRSVSRFDTSRS